MRERRIDINQESREQHIEISQSGIEQQVDTRPERSVLHGIDGVSPIATVTQTETGATISITDRDGTTTADILNGPQGPKGEKGDKGDTGPQGPKGEKGDPGANGFSPIANVTKSGDTATITITDKNGTTTATVKDGSDATVTVDSALSSTSENPVQNKVINSALNAKADSSDIPTKTSDLTNDSGFLTTSTLPIVTSISSSSTDSQVPSAKCMYTAIGDVESILTTLNNGGGAQ